MLLMSRAGADGSGSRIHRSCIDCQGVRHLHFADADALDSNHCAWKSVAIRIFRPDIRALDMKTHAQGPQPPMNAVVPNQK